MGFRMYCDTYPESTAKNKDNESPKFFAYVDEPESYKVLQKLYLDGKIQTLHDEDRNKCFKLDYYWEFESYDNFCCLPYTDSFVLSAKDFKSFMTQFISDLLDNNYNIRDSWLLYMKELMSNESKKVIEWG